MAPSFLRKCIYSGLVHAGLSFFSTLASISALQVIADPRLCLVASGTAAGLGFFISLTIQIGKMSDGIFGASNEKETHER